MSVDGPVCIGRENTTLAQLSTPAIPMALCC
jgi:hypothetical protein